MKARTYIAAAGSAALLGAGAFLLPASAATAAHPASATHARTHTLRFISVTKRTISLSRTSIAQQDTDVTRSGKAIGFDNLNITFNPRTGSGHGNFAFDTRGGFIFGTLHLTASGATGRVTGGTGTFRRARGSLTARSLNKAGTRTAVTIRYRH
jgi:hypothetical protein